MPEIHSITDEACPSMITVRSRIHYWVDVQTTHVHRDNGLTIRVLGYLKLRSKRKIGVKSNLADSDDKALCIP